MRGIYAKNLIWGQSLRTAKEHCEQGLEVHWGGGPILIRGFRHLPKARRIPTMALASGAA